MFGSQVLDAGIGLALLFFFMSIVATAICELIENVIKKRAKYLETGIKQLLNVGSSNDLADQFYNHPLVAALYNGTYKPGTRSLPSYIPRQTFSLALLQILASDNAALSIDKLKASLEGKADPAADVKIEPNKIQQVVLTAIDVAGNDISAVRKFLEDWFDSTMDRVAGWYKRRTGFILAGVGLLAAIILNVDAIEVGRSLMLDTDLRKAAVAQAAPVLSAGEGGKAVGTEQLPELRKHIDAIGLPIFWTYKDGWLYPKAQACKPVLGNGTNAGDVECGSVFIGVLKAAPGWLVTMLAISLGAPFWFDILNRLVVVRSTVKPKEKSRDEDSKDPQKTPAKKPPSAGAASPAASDG